jgi:inner membrane protein involved in colicin E2 resistance
MAGRLDACPCAGTTLDRLLQPAILAILPKGRNTVICFSSDWAGCAWRGGASPTPRAFTAP